MPTKQTGNKIAVASTLPPALYNEVRDKALNHDISVSALIRVLLSDYVKNPDHIKDAIGEDAKIEKFSDSIMPDTWIREQKGMIDPFVHYKKRTLEGKPVISYGTSSYGYDLRLSSKEFYIFKPSADEIDPKNFNAEDHLEQAELHKGESGKYFVMPPNSYALGVTLERVAMPDNVLGIVLGKSTYARTALVCNCTPIEPGWEGHITLEFCNGSNSPIMVYADEGICQLLFLRGSACSSPYGTGKYQNQDSAVTVAKV